MNDIQIIENWLVEIPSGEVRMRDDRIKKEWNVQISSFLLSKYPVTQALYKAVTNTNPSTFKGDKLPVETVTWVEAIQFCNILSTSLGYEPCYNIHSETQDISFNPKAKGFRLPTEAEWQFACLADFKEKNTTELTKYAWFKENSSKTTHHVGLKSPNSWGLYDMLGNVWEWCTDIYDETVYGEYRIFRGGGWFDEKRSVMPTTRRRSHPYSFKIDDLGFRVARNV